MEISPYGYNKDMLVAIYADLLPPVLSMPTKLVDEGCCFNLLALPNELLLKILQYVLPRSRCDLSKQGFPTWIPSRTSVLATCRRLNELGTPILYGENDFRIQLRWHEIVAHFAFEPKKSHGHQDIVLRKEVAFPGALMLRCLSLLKYISVEVELPDDYITSSKFNIGGRALFEAIKRQMISLCHSVSQAKCLERLQISVYGVGLKAKHFNKEDVLASFLELRNVKCFELHIGSSGANETYEARIKQIIEHQFVHVDDRQDLCALQNEGCPKGHGKGLFKRCDVQQQAGLNKLPSTHYLSTTAAFYVPP